MNKKNCVVFDVAKKVAAESIFPCSMDRGWFTRLSLSPNLLNSTLRRIKLKTFLISMEAGGCVLCLIHCFPIFTL